MPATPNALHVGSKLVLAIVHGVASAPDPVLAPPGPSSSRAKAAREELWQSLPRHKPALLSFLRLDRWSRCRTRLNGWPNFFCATSIRAPHIPGGAKTDRRG